MSLFGTQFGWNDLYTSASTLFMINMEKPIV